MGKQESTFSRLNDLFFCGTRLQKRHECEQRTNTRRLQESHVSRP